MFLGLFWLCSYSFKCFHVVLLKWLLFLFISSFCSSSFHLFSLSFFVSSCFLVSFTFLSLTSFCWSLYYLCVSSCQTLCKKKYLFELLQNSLFSVFSFPSKSQFSLFPFLLGLSQTFFPCFVFCLLKNGFSFCLTLLFFYSSCKLCFFFLLSFFWCIQE